MEKYFVKSVGTLTWKYGLNWISPKACAPSSHKYTLANVHFNCADT